MRKAQPPEHPANDLGFCGILSLYAFRRAPFRPALDFSLAHDVFISYTNADKSAADAVCRRLEEAGIRCWIAPRDVGYGRDWAASIDDAISNAKLLVVIFSAAANASRHVRDEVGTALDTDVTIIPFRIEDIRPTGALRLHLRSLHWLDALRPPLDEHIDRLIESAKRSLPAAGEGEEEQRWRPEPVAPGRYGALPGLSIGMALPRVSTNTLAGMIEEI